MVYIGIDGCKLGWFTVSLDAEGNWEINSFGMIDKLWEHCKASKLILIDITIGLRDGGIEERICDKEARQILGPKRGSTVFRVPCRAAVYTDTYRKASEANAQMTGKKLPKQTWGIIPKIREVDQLLLADASARTRIKEIHPEVCFWALNNCQSMRYSKKKVEGFEERRKVLRSVYPYTDDVLNYSLQKYRRKEVSKDDILDALVAAVTASKERLGLLTIPEVPEFDSKMLPMEMVYFSNIKNR
jgi:predicted RNase H-like nuclease